MGLSKAMELLTREYLQADPEKNPVKHSIPLTYDKSGQIKSYANSMATVLSNGYFGGKFVYVDEEKGRLTGKVFVFDPKGNVVLIHDAGKLTPIRCGLMAALCIRQFYENEADLISNLKVGFIGAGRINSATARVLHRQLGMDGYSLLASPRNPERTMTYHPDAPVSVKQAHSFDELDDCDVIISCTNMTDRAEAMRTTDLKTGRTRLYVAQDGGWMFGPSFRADYPSFTDNRGQLFEYIDHEFPFDGDLSLLPTFEEFREPSFTYRNGSAVVYLTGMALADVAVSMGLAENSGGSATYKGILR